jgi:hypothetical protein
MLFIHIIQLIGVFITVLVGLPTIVRIYYKTQVVPVVNIVWIAIGITMICGGFFF